MNWYKTSQIKNYLHNLGYDEVFCDYVSTLPKEKQKQIGQIINNIGPINKEEIIKQIENNTIPTNNSYTSNNIIDKRFTSENEKDEFFNRIPREYYYWVYNILNNDNFHFIPKEDGQRLFDDLEKFSILKKQNINIEKDINKYRDLYHLEEIINENNNIIIKNRKKFEINPINLPGVRIIKQENGYIMYSVENEESLSIMGSGTRWCTRKEYENCAASEYIQKYGVIYIISKNNIPLIQMTPNFSQVMDINDKKIKTLPINIDELIVENIRKINLEQTLDEGRYRDDYISKDIISGIEYGSQKLKNNKKIVFEALKRDKYALKFASKKIRDDTSFILKSIKETNGFALQFASNRIKDDYNIILEAIKLNGFTIIYASERLKNDYNLAKISVINDPSSFRHLSSEIRNNEDIILEATKKILSLYFSYSINDTIKWINELIIKYIPDSLKNNSIFINNIYNMVKISKNKQSFLINRWYKTSQKLTPQQIGLYTNFKNPGSIKTTGSGLSSSFKIPGTNQVLNGSELINKVLSKIQNVLIQNNVHTIDTSPVSGYNVIGLAASSEPGTIHVDIAKILDLVKNQSLPPITQLDGTVVDKDVQNDIIEKVSNFIINQVGNTAAHESEHNNTYLNLFKENKPFSEAREEPAENFGNQIANEHFKY